MTDRNSEAWSWTASSGCCECIFEDDAHPPHEDPADCPNWLYEECANIGQAHTIDMGDFMGLDDDTARRICACWNACIGLRTEQLENANLGQVVQHASKHWVAWDGEPEDILDLGRSLAPFRGKPA